ncbi:MAG: hypothetical protein DMG36_22310 [Acidobacteria bacterium]|nr:MAG: hypothetical protein DMG36_22310 [Acidobacteriota bacterium]
MSRKSKGNSRRRKNYRLENRGGQLVKRIQIPSELADELRAQMERFRAKFGREPGPTDPVFFDPDADEPRPLNIDAAFDELAAIAGEVGVSPQLIYAMKKTGRIVTENNKQFLTPAELKEWNDAIEEYHQKIRASGVM